MPQIISIVGTSSNSGKTTLLEKLIPELKKRGYKIGVIKHVPHGFNMDKKGKDTYRHKAAGADTVVAAAPGQIAMIKDIVNDTLDDLKEYFSDMDIILSEGYKNENKPKIEVFSGKGNQEPLCVNQNNFIALVTDTDVNVDIPCFHFEQIEAIADIIQENIVNS